MAIRAGGRSCSAGVVAGPARGGHGSFGALRLHQGGEALDVGRGHGVPSDERREPSQRLTKTKVAARGEGRKGRWA